MAALSLILLPVTSETPTPTKNEGSSSVSQQPYDDHQYQNVYHTTHCQHQRHYQDQYQYTSTTRQVDHSSTPRDTMTPHLSHTQSNPVNEIVFYQRCWEAIHQRTIKQLEWVKDAERGLYTSAQLQSMLCASFRAKLMP